MQLTQKHIISISAVAILAILGYITLQNSAISSSDRVGTDTISQSGIETNTIKRMETVANSGTNWGMSPFGSGKPLTEEQKPEFRKPNTEWKSRSVTLSDGRTLYYEFGKGNPVGVIPLSEEEKTIYQDCYIHPDLIQATCDSKIGPKSLEGYLNPDVEKDLLTLLSHPAWKLVLINCESDFRAFETTDGFTPIMDNQFTYDRVMTDSYLDIERYYYISPETGRKLIEIYPLQQWFGNVLRHKQSINTAKDILNINSCITQNGGMELYRLMNIIQQKQLRPL